MDYIKRHSVWIAVIIFSLFMIAFMVKQKTGIEHSIDKITLNIDAKYAQAEQMTPYAKQAVQEQVQPEYSKIAELEAQKSLTNPFTALLYIIIGAVLIIPLATLILFSLTKAPFLKFLIKGRNNELDEVERNKYFDVICAVVVGVAFIIGCGILGLILT